MKMIKKIIFLFAFAIGLNTLSFAADTSSFLVNTKSFRDMSRSERQYTIREISAYLNQDNAFDKTTKKEIKELCEKYKKDNDAKKNISLARGGVKNTPNYNIDVSYNQNFSGMMDYYTISYHPGIRYLYNNFGSLLAIEVVKGSPSNPPYYKCRYTNIGNLVQVDYISKINEEYNFNPSGNFIRIKILDTYYQYVNNKLYEQSEPFDLHRSTVPNYVDLRKIDYLPQVTTVRRIQKKKK